ncbi:hypothetical protein IFM89_036363 [Coptis chinensis]|uniref:Uncharacterized protein n=1 Tax=Coptis chinensis TaxID=261450 RepID=A0A835HJ25_9MAGN|nr:hypothetical protein IFM89_036363 [Coptis chinensis]
MLGLCASVVGLQLNICLCLFTQNNADEINKAEEHPHIVQSTHTNIPESVKEGLQSKAGESNGTQMVAELVKNSYSKRAREKLIVGWDEIFEETVDHIQSLTAETFSRHVNELWKTSGVREPGVEISELKVEAEDYRKARMKIEEEMADLQAQVKTAQVMVDELMDQVDKIDENLPILDALFENSAKNPL